MLRGLLLTYLYYRALAISITGGVVHGDELMYGTKPPRRYSVTSSAKGRHVLRDKPSRPLRMAVTSSANGRHVLCERPSRPLRMAVSVFTYICLIVYHL